MSLTLSAARMFAGIFSCAQPHAPPVTLIFHDNPPQIRTGQPPTRMMSLRKKSISPDYGGAFPEVDGLTSGTFKIKYSLNFTDEEQVMRDSACVWTKNARISVTYTPVIYISKKAPPGSCRYKETIAHEMRHVGADLSSINEFLPEIRSSAEAALAPQHDPRPVRKKEVDAFQKKISNRLSRTIEKITAALQRTRKIRQMKIDTRQEYERLSHACPQER